MRGGSTFDLSRATRSRASAEWRRWNAHRARPRVARASFAPPVVRRARNNFDGLRLIAALLVVYGHLTVDHTGTGGLRLLMFFAISGFLVAGSWLSDPHVPRFLARRALRVWPAYAALVIACAAISAVFPSPDLPGLSRLASAFYLSNLWFSGFDWGFFPASYPMMNRSLWMLPFEVDTYLAFGLVALLGRRARIGVAVVLLIVALRAQPTPVAAGRLFESWSLCFGGFFAFGVLLRELPRLRGGLVVASCVVAGLAACGMGERITGLLLIIPPAAVWIGERSWPVLRSAARFGDLSYGVFLWSFPIQQVTRLWLDPGSSVLLPFVVVTMQALAIAWLSYRFVETPALRFKPRRRAAAPAPPSAPRVGVPATLAIDEADGPRGLPGIATLGLASDRTH